MAESAAPTSNSHCDANVSSSKRRRIVDSIANVHQDATLFLEPLHLQAITMMHCMVWHPMLIHLAMSAVSIGLITVTHQCKAPIRTGFA